MKAKKRYIVDLMGEDEALKKRFEYDSYNKEQIENSFIDLCDSSSPGDTIEYWTQDNK